MAKNPGTAAVTDHTSSNGTPHHEDRWNPPGAPPKELTRTQRPYAQGGDYRRAQQLGKPTPGVNIEIISSSLERLQNMSERDANTEGFPHSPATAKPPLRKQMEHRTRKHSQLELG